MRIKKKPQKYVLFFTLEFSKPSTLGYVRECLCSQNMCTKVFMWNNVSNIFSLVLEKKKNIHKYVCGQRGKPARGREGWWNKKGQTINNWWVWAEYTGVPHTITETFLQVSSYIKIITKTKKLLNLAQSFHFYYYNILFVSNFLLLISQQILLFHPITTILNQI